MVTSGLRDDWKTGGRKNEKQQKTESVVAGAAAT
jgi:hypothetical protein